MKKKYKKPNICTIDFDILDIICTSGETSEIIDDDDEFLGKFMGPSPRGKKSNGGFDGIGWY